MDTDACRHTSKQNSNGVLPVTTQDYRRTKSARRPTENAKNSKPNAHQTHLAVV